jgi:hypothetical protein
MVIVIVCVCVCVCVCAGNAKERCTVLYSTLLYSTLPYCIIIMCSLKSEMQSEEIIMNMDFFAKVTTLRSKDHESLDLVRDESKKSRNLEFDPGEISVFLTCISFHTNPYFTEIVLGFPFPSFSLLTVK